MARLVAHNFAMNDPQTRTSLPPEKPLAERRDGVSPEILTDSSRKESGGQGILFGGLGVRAGWRILGYFVLFFLTAYWLMWLGASFFPEPVSGVASLWREMYQEVALVLGALLPAILMARFEERSLADYGLPPHAAFGKMFWVGAGWGLAAITLLLLALRALHAFYFGQMVLHGSRALRFALFWGVYFVLVGVFEEFLLRGYALYTLSRSWGFWPAAAMLSLMFGVIHMRNPGETWIGLLGVVAIGMFFCLTLYRTGSLWFAVGFHAFWDWGQTFLYSVPDSGTMEPGHLMRPAFHGRDWLTGGSVGPEASVMCFVVIAGVAGVFARRYRGVRWTADLRQADGKSS